MSMIKKFCSSCLRNTWHNPKPKGELRCTFCGFPVSSNPAKRDPQETIRRKQAALPILVVA